VSQKPQRPIPEWLRLDNAAKIYPAARTKGWMPLFRVSMTLDEDVDEALMQQALQATLRRIPLFSYRLRRGLFWHYFERQGREPVVEPDARNPMLPINLTAGRGFQFRLRVHRKRVALEVFHALADGSGAFTFLGTLVAEYLFLRTGERTPAAPPVLDTRDEPRPEEWEDSFAKYARGATRPRTERKAWQLRGTPGKAGLLRVTTGVMDTGRLKEAARNRGATVNTLLCALLLKALIARKAQSARGRRRPVKLSVPVNLRRYYPSQTLRNFSFYVNVPVDTGLGGYSLDELIALVGHYMGLETAEKALNARFSLNVQAERNALLRAAPLFVKTLVLKLMYRFTGESYMTSTLTNLGQVDLPPRMGAYVKQVEIILGPAQRTPISCAVVSAFGRTSVNFSRTIQESLVERDFFTSLVDLGVPVFVQSNES